MSNKQYVTVKLLKERFVYFLGISPLLLIILSCAGMGAYLGYVHGLRTGDTLCTENILLGLKIASEHQQPAIIQLPPGMLPPGMQLEPQPKTNQAGVIINPFVSR